jgi:dihydrofolate reductase
MRIKTHIGVSLDGHISTPDGWPAILTSPDFESGRSHGHPEFIAGCGAVVMGRNTFEPAVGSSHLVAADKPAELLELMRAADFTGDVHLVGGQRTIDAFREIGALDSFGVVTLPILLGDGTRLTPLGSVRESLVLESSRTFGDGSVEHIYRSQVS